MNIETLGLNISDITGAKKYSEMDKESLVSYIGKVALKLALENEFPKLIDVLNSIFIEMLKSKINRPEKEIEEICFTMASYMLSELNLHIAKSNLTKEHIETIVEPFIEKIAFINETDFEKIIESKTDESLLSIGLVNDAIINEEITSDKKNMAFDRYSVLPDSIIKIIENIKINIIEKSKKLEDKIKQTNNLDFWGKSILGLIVDIFGGNIISKMIYVDAIANEQMVKKIKEEGIIHFTSNYNADKIINSEDSYIRASSATLSGGRGKSYFFAGVPSFKDLTINIYSYNVMYGVRIHPTDEQIKRLTYREYNDKAIAHNGNFHFTKDQIEKVYYGLKMDEEGNLFYQEITEEEALKYQIDDRVKKLYNGDASIKHKFMCNAYGFYYELENYKKLLNRIKNRNFEVEQLNEQKNI